MKVLHIISGLVMFIGALVILATAGSSDLELLKFSTIVARLLIGTGLIGLGFMGFKFGGFDYVD